MKFATMFGIIGLLTAPVIAQGVPVAAPSPPIDTSQFAKAADQAALSQTVNQLASGMVKTVAGNSPDPSTGNVQLPTAFSGISMTQTTFTSPMTLDGSPVATISTLSGYATSGALSSAISGEVASRNSAIATAVAPLATSASVANEASARDAAIATAVSPLATSASLTNEATARANADAGEVTNRNSAIATAVAGTVKTINGIGPDGTGAVTLPVSSYVAGFTNAAPGVLANLYANAPCNSSRSNMLATVSDLYGSVTETMRCTNFGAWGYGWRAQRPDYAATLSTTGGTLTINCNVTPQSISLQGALTSGLTVSFSTTNCTPGQREEIQNGLLLGALTATATGLVGTVTSKALGTATSTFIFDAAGWRAY